MRAADEGFDDPQGQAPVLRIESVHRFIQDEQFRILDEGAGKQAEALLAAGQSQIGAVRQVFNAKKGHPFPAALQLSGAGMQAQADRVEKAAGDDLQGREVLPVSPVHLGADIADVALDFPDTFPRAARVPEQGDLAGVGLGIVGADQGQEGGFAGTVFPTDRPMLSFPDDPVQAVEDCTGAVADRHGIAAHDLRRRAFRIECNLRQIPLRQGKNAGLRV